MFFWLFARNTIFAVEGGAPICGNWLRVGNAGLLVLEYYVTKGHGTVLALAHVGGTGPMELVTIGS